MLVLLLMNTGIASAQEAEPITGTVQTVELETNATTGETIVVVTLQDQSTGESQTITIPLEIAVSLGLVTTDPATGISTANENAGGSVVEVDPNTIVEDDDQEVEEEHPVGSALGDFFGDLLGADYETIMTVHEGGVGFGVIAQALWLTNTVGGDTSTFQALIDAKQTGDYSGITLADGSTPDNWGDVVKSLKKGDNLGSIMSGKAEVDSAEEDAFKIPNKEKDHGNNGNNNGNGNGNGNGNNGNGNNGNGNGGHP